MAIEYFGGTKTVEDPTAKFRAALAERERRGLSTAGMCWSEKRGWHPRPREDRASRNTPRPESAHTSAMLAEMSGTRPEFARSGRDYSRMLNNAVAQNRLRELRAKLPYESDDVLAKLAEMGT